MENTENIYIELQKHLDKQAVGFPSTRSGVEIRILKELFTPEQANLALYLSYVPQSPSDIHNSAKSSGLSPEKVKNLLDEMVINGAIGTMVKGEVTYYYLMPLLIGIVEWHGGKATPQFWNDFNEYLTEGYVKAYASTRLSQMRTIPVEKSIDVEHHVTTYDHIKEIIDSTDGPISINACMCREGAKARGESCQVTSRIDTCMAFGDWARHFISSGISREVSKEEALEIMRRNQEDGLVLQPTNYQKIDFVCACCGCCCGVLKIQKRMPKPAEQWTHNFHAAVAAEMCTACGICAEKCQVNAATLEEDKEYATINLDRCIGCGNCVAACPSEALQLVRIEEPEVPPEDRTSLYRILSERD